MNNKRTFFQYVIPSVLSFALSGVYAIVDGFFVGNSIGDAGLSAINIAYPITAVLQSVGTGIGMGGSVKYSILKAAGNEKKAREFVAGATWLMLLFSAVLTVTVFFTSEKILSALGASGELLTLGNEYIKVIALGAILQVFGTGLVPFMRNYGGSLWAMIAMICGFATNVALDYTFVWVLGRGMYGAALATIIGQGVTMAVALVYCAIKKNLTLKIAPVDTPKTAFQILKIGLAPFGLTLAPNISLVIINRFSVYYGGQEAIATYACISYIICIVYLLLQGVGDGSQPLMSQFYGAGEEKSLKQTKTLAYEFSMVLAVISAILIYLLRGKIGLLFGSSADNYTQYRDWKDAKVHQEKEKEKEAAKAQEDKTAKVRLNEKRRMSFKEKREFEQLEQEIADLETEKNAIEEALCSGTLSVDELTEKSKRLPELSDLIDEKTLRWLELSEIESN